jgi:ElaB/YqjD/DUF883 family membrane-anchored ribosome-binding protein
MANSSLRKASLQSMEAEIESLLKSLENLKDDASDESRKTLKVLKGNAENALKHSRHLLADAYEEVKVKTRETGYRHSGLRPGTPMDYSGCCRRCTGPAGGLSAVQTR